MAQQPTTQDDSSELTFPVGGLELTHPSLMGRPDTSPVAENVRFFEPLTGRGRGGARSGISKFIEGEVSGEHVIQHITSIVTVDGEMIDFSFDGPNQMFPGIYAGIGFIDFNFTALSFQFPDFGTIDGVVFNGASGYPPEAGRKPKNSKIILSLYTNTPEWPSSSLTQVFAQLLDTNGAEFGSAAATFAGKTVKLYTDPPGEDGDGDSDGATSLIAFNVSAVVEKPDEERVVYYRAKLFSVHGSLIATSERIKVKYTRDDGFVFVQSTRTHDVAASGAQRSLAFTSAVEVGSLLVAVVWCPGGIGTVTDSQGNAWVSAGGAGAPGTLFWAKASATGACTVMFTPNAPNLVTFALLNYTCPAAASAFDVKVNSDSGVNADTFAAVLVDGVSNLFIGVLHYTGTEVNTTFTPQTGYTLRINDPLQTVGIGDHALFVWDRVDVNSSAILGGTLGAGSFAWTCEGFSFSP